MEANTTHLKCEIAVIAKNFKQWALAVALLSLIMGLACCSSPKLSGGGDNPQIPDDSEVVSIAYLRSLYKNSALLISENIKIEGTVISDHRCGTFYKQIVVEDESGGIKIKVDTESNSLKYAYLDRVAIRCNSLTLGSYGGHLELGFASDESTKQVEPIDAKYLETIITTLEGEGSEEFEKLSIAQLSSRYLSCCVAIDGVQFVDDELGRKWSEVDEDTNRHVVDINGNTLIVRSSHRAKYADNMLPRGSGMIFGILGVFNNQYQLTVINEREINMGNPRF